MGATNGDILDTNGNGHTLLNGSVPLDLGLTSAQKYERLSSTTASTAANKEGPPKLNRYALGCALLASLNSILLGYGTSICSCVGVSHRCFHL